jgi:hypothetical protein
VHRKCSGKLTKSTVARASLDVRQAPLPGGPKPLRDHRYLDIALNLGDELRSRLHRYTLGFIEAIAVY